MKAFFLASIITLLSLSSWETDFNRAKETAKSKHQLILLNFSGSDWCGPCIRMHKEIFADENFGKMAADRLVMVNADFPRSKKNQLSATLKKQNEDLAEKYNPKGSFPFTVLIDADGKVIKEWEGLPKASAEEFTADLKKICDEVKR